MLTLKFYNSLTRKLEEFIPLNPSQAKMYVCGPTVYDRPHIGNARSSLVYDLIFRLLKYIYEDVLFVRNITDVDDKIIVASKERNIHINDLTKIITKDFHDDLDYLGCLRPSVEPKATEHIKEMIQVIEKLIENGHAYTANGHVYFDVTSDKNYGELAGRTLDEMIAGVRIEVSENKKHPGDFVLWKPMDEEDSEDSVFDSPYGKGRPGWHIECSAMSMRYLGQNFDLHGGGADLMFPHHTNEIAQSTCAFPGSEFAKYWVHNGFVTVNGEKMSKSLGNFLTVYDLRNKNIDGAALRLALLSTHYRKPLDFNEKTLSDAEKTLSHFRRTTENVQISKLDEEFIRLLADDLNISEALAWMHRIEKEARTNKEAAEKLKGAIEFIGIDYSTKQQISTLTDIQILELIHKRSEAKKAKNYSLADNIRNDLLAQGVSLEDTAEGTIFRRK
ncbi:MAG: cysteine--tRNA ligase [Sphingobacteriia bacterium]|nr:cysteine--tRNA ligase [Sphingobacteriia bacterium]